MMYKGKKKKGYIRRETDPQLIKDKLGFCTHRETDKKDSCPRENKTKREGGGKKERGSPVWGGGTVANRGKTSTRGSRLKKRREKRNFFHFVGGRTLLLHFEGKKPWNPQRTGSKKREKRGKGHISRKKKRAHQKA